jgi:hypothetical protein
MASCNLVTYSYLPYVTLFYYSKTDIKLTKVGIWTEGVCTLRKTGAFWLIGILGHLVQGQISFSLGVL